MAWSNEIELRGGWPRETVAVGVDADGDLAFMNFEGQAIVVHKDEAGRLVNWIMENFGTWEGSCGKIYCGKDCGEVTFGEKSKDG